MSKARQRRLEAQVGDFYIEVARWPLANPYLVDAERQLPSTCRARIASRSFGIRHATPDTTQQARRIDHYRNATTWNDVSRVVKRFLQCVRRRRSRHRHTGDARIDDARKSGLRQKGQCTNGNITLTPSSQGSPGHLPAEPAMTTRRSGWMAPLMSRVRQSFERCHCERFAPSTKRADGLNDGRSTG